MKVKNIVLGVKAKEAFFKDLSSNWKKLEKGQSVEENEAVYFSSIEAMRKALTPLRIEILKTIKERRPSSIYELAKMMNKDSSNINSHVMHLAEIGLIEMEQQSDGRGNIIPLVIYDEIDIKIPLLGNG